MREHRRGTRVRKHPIAALGRVVCFDGKIGRSAQMCRDHRDDLFGPGLHQHRQHVTRPAPEGAQLASRCATACQQLPVIERASGRDDGDSIGRFQRVPLDGLMQQNAGRGGSSVVHFRALSHLRLRQLEWVGRGPCRLVRGKFHEQGDECAEHVIGDAVAEHVLAYVPIQLEPVRALERLAIDPSLRRLTDAVPYLAPGAARAACGCIEPDRARIDDRHQGGGGAFLARDVAHHIDAGVQAMIQIVPELRLDAGRACAERARRACINR